MKQQWSTHTDAMIWINSYSIEHPTRRSGKYVVYEMRYEALDCYSRTKTTNAYSIGSAKTLKEAQKIAETHAADAKRSYRDSE